MTVSVPAEDAANHAPDGSGSAATAADQGRFWHTVLLVVLIGSAAVLTLWTLALQALAVIPVDWLQPFLDSFRAQKQIILVSGRRDALGVWNVMVALAALALALAAVRLAPRAERPCRWTVGVVRAVTGAAATGTVASAVTYGWLVVAVAQAGAGVHLVAPALPFTADYGKPDKTVTYGTPGGQALQADLYLPDGHAERPVPVVVHVHGGGFIDGRRAPTAHLRHLADNGYAILDVDYRLASLENHNWDTQVRDVGCALTWLTSAGAAGHGLDTSRVALLGTSAGGNLAINAAYMTNGDTLEPTCRGATDLPRINAVIGLYPVVDVTALNQSAIGRAIGERYIGGTPAEHPGRYAFTNSLTHLSAEAPPTLILQGGRDHLVRADAVRDFADAVPGRGVRCRYVELPTMEHGAGDLIAGSITLGTIAQRNLTVDWLDRYAG